VKPGDLVRFKPPYYINVVDGVYCSDPRSPGWKDRLIGLLVKYEPWEKMAEVFWGGSVYRIAARDVEKAGIKDENR
tara:strand:- start:216 stop:443 length:228 start_codon:yes stop_codon:yes gene_type:complete